MIGVTVCVNYGHLLKRTLPVWIVGLEQCVIVTDHNDAEVDELRTDNVRLYRTDAFYRGAVFNKGGALSAAFDHLGLRDANDWLCLFDADIMPPKRWHQGLGDLKPGNLYSAPRWQADAMSDIDRPDLERIAEGPDGLCGYFLLFHATDAHLPQPPEPVFTGWQHAGNYDTVFTLRWPTRCYRMLPLRMIHVGTDRNWWGVGNAEMMRQMYAERRRRGGYEHEAVQ